MCTAAVRFFLPKKTMHFFSLKINKQKLFQKKTTTTKNTICFPPRPSQLLNFLFWCESFVTTQFLIIGDERKMSRQRCFDDVFLKTKSCFVKHVPSTKRTVNNVNKTPLLEKLLEEQFVMRELFVIKKTKTRREPL